ncbi:MAG: hypothetical protein AAF489_14855 [Bacteroidota bacterium]
MKRLVHIVVVSFLLFSCANSNKEASMSGADLSEAEVSESNPIDLSETTLMTNTDLAKAKLQDYFDLLILQQKHPEFKEDIRAQIRSLSESDLNISDSLSIISIENLRHTGPIERYGDSLQKIRFYFNLVSDNGRLEDSITAVLRTQKITLEQKEVTATKVTFERN